MNKIIYKKVSKNHFGVFANANIKKGEIIEVCPVIVVPLKEKQFMDTGYFNNYYFHWGSKNQPAIALGYGSLYNHSYQLNAEYDQKVKQRLIVFKAIKDIKKGQEIFTNYNGEPTDQSPVWFRVKRKILKSS